MVTLGIDAHKRTHTVVAVDDHGRQLATKTVGTRTKDHLGLLTWAEQFAGPGDSLLWAVEDCRHLSRTLERDLLAAGQPIVRVPPKLMAHVRDSARTYGKSDPIDALAVARAAQREPDLPVARLDGPDRDVRLLTDHRESLVNERTRLICRAAVVPARTRSVVGADGQITGPGRLSGSGRRSCRQHPGDGCAAGPRLGRTHPGHDR